MVGGQYNQRGWFRSSLSMLGKTILPPTDEELGKKDDDLYRHRDRRKGGGSGGGGGGGAHVWAASSSKSKSAAPGLRWRRRRILLVVVGLYALWMLFRNAPAIFGGQGGNQLAMGILGAEQDGGGVNDEPRGAPPGVAPPRKSSRPSHEYNGPIKFYRLAPSLHNAESTGGYRQLNRNVLFAASSLASAATLLPLVCEMSRWNRNYVHFAFLGREDIPVDDILEINGVDKENCLVYWHDARPDFTEYSTEARAESSVVAAMGHLHGHLHPQAVIVDDALSEDVFFTRGMARKTKMLDLPIVEIPKGRTDEFMWITRLDAGSLRSWHMSTVDVLIQAPSGSSGGLIRLLQSLRAADYQGLTPPRITIEMPAEVDPWVSVYVDRFVWPPDAQPEQSQLVIRRRISNAHSNQEEASVRFLELFYPVTTRQSHVLVLSPNAELSPLYFHYLKYLLLEYRYSTYGENEAANVMGLSLELPLTLLDGKTALERPKPADMHAPRYREIFPDATGSPFLWQAPNSHATLYFGDKWAELHSFLRNRIAKQRQETKATKRTKVVSEVFPAWMEYVLEFMRARGYAVLYPAPTSSGSEAFVTVHNEVYSRPEEFQLSPQEEKESQEKTKHHSADNQDSSPLPLNPSSFLRAEAPADLPARQTPEDLTVPTSHPLHLTLPFEADLPEIQHLPYLLHTGTMTPFSEVESLAVEFANTFRVDVGGCKIPAGKRRVVREGEAGDLFCGFGGEEWVDVEVEKKEESQQRESEQRDADGEDRAAWAGAGNAAPDGEDEGRKLGEAAPSEV